MERCLVIFIGIGGFFSVIIMTFGGGVVKDFRALISITFICSVSVFSGGSCFVCRGSCVRGVLKLLVFLRTSLLLATKSVIICLFSGSMNINLVLGSVFSGAFRGIGNLFICVLGFSVSFMMVIGSVGSYWSLRTVKPVL